LIHYKAGFVKIVDIGISDPVFRDYIAHKVKPALYKLWIFAQGPEIIVFTAEYSFKLWLSFNEVGGPILADA
jgi:hypothetical protein